MLNSQPNNRADINNVYQLLQYTSSQFSQLPAYYIPQQTNWQAISWSQYKQWVDEFALSLISQGFQIDSTLAILSANNLAWPVADLAAIAAGGIGVGLYPSSSSSQCEYILNHCEAGVLVVDSQVQLDKVNAIAKQLTYLQIVILAPGFKPEVQAISEHFKCYLWEDWLALAKSQQQALWEEYQEIACSRAYEATIIIVYTSGTTGQPKGACLSNRYVLSSVKALEHFLASVKTALPDPVKAQLANTNQAQFESISFLPYCHVAERISGMYTRLYTGDAAYLLDNIGLLNQTLKDVSPHGFGGLPRIYEKLYEYFMAELDKPGVMPFTRAEFESAFELSQEIKLLKQQGTSISHDLSESYRQAEENVYRYVRGFFGKRILFCSSGAAPLPKKVLDFFEHGGQLPILEAFGLTEFVCCAFNTPQQKRLNSVGKPMLGCKIKIATDGEILLKGLQMFSGYYKNKQASEECVDRDGWLHTGDIGKLDEDGFVYITGRKKEFIKTSTGKKIAPLMIENLVKRDHLISNIMVYGDNQKYLVALISINPLELQSQASVEASDDKHIQQRVQQIIAQANKELSSTEQIKKFTIIAGDFSLEQNEITPTGKIKRVEVSENYRDIIKKMYLR